MKISVATQIFLELSPTNINIIIILLSIIFVVGLIMNLLVLFFYAITPNMRSINNYFHMNVMLANLLCLCYNIPVQISYYLSYKQNQNVHMGISVCKLFLALMIIHSTVIGYTIVAISYHRYTTVKNSLQKTFTEKRAAIIIAMIWLFACLLAVPELIFTNTVTISSNLTICTQAFPSDTSKIVSYISINMLSFVLPLVWIVFTNLLMGYKVQKKFNKIRMMKGGLASSLSKSSSFNIGQTPVKVFSPVQFRLLKLTTALAIAYVICFIPTRIYDIVIAFIVPISNDTKRELTAIHVVCTFLYYANAAINPILYASLCHRFRVKLYQLICCS
ncbi:Apelin receptor A [Trichoplax sp. H2]|nr:Apelin receptor A [Trichoplax sp. H2]|eukprot:RDD45467.1 Apelin receptor A [Trichoplax sp. H2]